MSNKIEKVKDVKYVEVDAAEGTEETEGTKAKVVKGVKKYGKKIGKGILIGGGLLLAYALGMKSSGKKRAAEGSYDADEYVDVQYDECETQETESETTDFDV